MPRHTKLPSETSELDSVPTLCNESGSFVNKPPRGWLHPDKQIIEQGMCYGVRYIGCLEINTSMKSLDFETRSQVAKESICRVCEVAGLITADRRRKIDKRVSRMLASAPNMDNAGTNVTLTITSAFLRLATLESGRIIASHEMPNISFASGGDTNTLDFVAYVAKDRKFGRACFIIECGGGLAQDVITTIGQAFELRFKEYLQNDTNRQRTPSPRIRQNQRSDHDYYNDLPGTGKSPPPETPPPVPPLPATFLQPKKPKPSKENLPPPAFNMIDLTTDLPPAKPSAEHNYVNDSVVQTGKETKDPFDMQPFTQILPALIAPETKTGAIPKQNGAQCPKRAQLLQEPWFHGTISRKEGESLVREDGDFLVRESQGSPGQYVLTGMQNGQRKHLLLVDPEGVVRTRDRTFESVTHLIQYHNNNRLPIISAESALLLKKPVHRTSSFC